MKLSAYRLHKKLKLTTYPSFSSRFSTMAVSQIHPSHHKHEKKDIGDYV